MEPFPLPRIDDLFGSLHGFRCLSKIYLRSEKKSTEEHLTKIILELLKKEELYANFTSQRSKPFKDWASPKTPTELPSDEKARQDVHFLETTYQCKSLSMRGCFVYNWCAS
ncbi:hypothetical protein Tco_0791686 [Tanacetum coccineum]